MGPTQDGWPGREVRVFMGSKKDYLENKVCEYDYSYVIFLLPYFIFLILSG